MKRVVLLFEKGSPRECVEGYDTLVEEIIFQKKESITAINGDAPKRVALWFGVTPSERVRLYNALSIARPAQVMLVEVCSRV